MLQRTDNPWQYPAPVRQLVLSPVRAAGVEPPIACNVPLVDAVYMTARQGILIPLANYTARPIDRLKLNVRVPWAVGRVESVRQGAIAFRQPEPEGVQFALPLENNDFVALYPR